MKYIITESQNENVAKKIESLLNRLFSDESEWICEVKVYVNEENERFLYDIYVYLSINALKLYNDAGQTALSKSIKNKVDEAMTIWTSLNFEDYYVGTLAKEC